MKEYGETPYLFTVKSITFTSDDVPAWSVTFKNGKGYFRFNRKTIKVWEDLLFSFRTHEEVASQLFNFLTEKDKRVFWSFLSSDESRVQTLKAWLSDLPSQVLCKDSKYNASVIGVLENNSGYKFQVPFISYFHSGETELTAWVHDSCKYHPVQILAAIYKLTPEIMDIRLPVYADYFKRNIICWLPQLTRKRRILVKKLIHLPLNELMSLDGDLV